MARTLARDLRIDQILAANSHFGRQPSNPPAQVDSCRAILLFHEVSKEGVAGVPVRESDMV
jgi:hypothetical protein